VGARETEVKGTHLYSRYQREFYRLRLWCTHFLSSEGARENIISPKRDWTASALFHNKRQCFAFQKRRNGADVLRRETLATSRYTENFT
jgi:hypothetical protein